MSELHTVDVDCRDACVARAFAETTARCCEAHTSGKTLTLTGDTDNLAWLVSAMRRRGLVSHPDAAAALTDLTAA